MRKNAELADVKARYMERQREAENYKRRVDVIDQLRAAQAGPVNLLNTVGETVNNTEAVWLNSMKDSGRQRRYRRHGPEHGRGSQPDFESAEDRILHQHRNQRDLPGRHFQGNAGFQFHLDLRKGEVLGRRKNMANFSEMSGIKQWAAVVGVGLVLLPAPCTSPCSRASAKPMRRRRLRWRPSSAKTRNWNPTGPSWWTSNASWPA